MVFVKYSPEIKTICVRWLLQGKSVDSINCDLQTAIHPRSCARWKALYERTREVVRNPATYDPRGRPPTLTNEEVEFILEVLQVDPTLYLDELQKKLLEATGENLAISTIHGILVKRLGQSRKTVRTVHPAQCPLKRAQYSIDVSVFPSNFLVFTDESAICVESQRRRMGWSTKGQRTHRVPVKRASLKYSLLPAISLNGPLGIMLQEGSINQADFEYFLNEILLANMSPFPGPNSVLVMDNAKIHHAGAVAEICARHCVLVVYLPPYSPDFNPIEKIFAVFKQTLRRLQVLTGRRSDADIIRNLFHHVAKPALISALYKNCGYPVPSEVVN